MIYIDEPRLLELLDKAVAERGESYKYEQVHIPAPGLGTVMISRCMYVDKTTGYSRPSCLVGMVLYLAGVALEMLDVAPSVVANDLLTELHYNSGMLTVDTAVREHLIYAQDAQDRGTSWGTIAADVRRKIESRDPESW